MLRAGPVEIVGLVIFLSISDSTFFGMKLKIRLKNHVTEVDISVNMRLLVETFGQLIGSN
jgi:hypothetical protein